MLQLDLTSEDFFRDPRPQLRRLREAGPVVEVKLPLFGRVWMATTQETVARVLKDSATFSLRKPDGNVAGIRWWMPGIVRTLASNMLTVDEPDHTRLREIVEEAFRRRAVLEMEPRIRSIAETLAGDLFAQGSPADLVNRYARLLPVSVICELLGLPLADRPKFMGWAARATSANSAIRFLRMLPTMVTMRRYLERQLEHARQGQGTGLIAELVAVEKEGAPITRDEMVSTIFLLLFAGHETTTHLISGSVFELAKNPALRDWLAADWSRADLAVEEFLRFVCPVQLSKPRYVRRDIDLGGVQLKRGDQITAGLASANMDPAANPRPEELDLARKPNRHVAFGTGIHFCLGHQLARLEAKCALQALYTRWPRLALAVAPEAIHWLRRPGMRSIINLPVMPSESAAVSAAHSAADTSHRAEVATS
ncbi:MAG: cytochrome P450 [Xanthobacteraceae bacterium]|nr:cytochrome P450 [Xanthobacteraceae bacterium]